MIIRLKTVNRLSTLSPRLNFFRRLFPTARIIFLHTPTRKPSGFHIFIRFVQVEISHFALIFNIVERGPFLSSKEKGFTFNFLHGL
jgi:hypothetical protein